MATTAERQALIFLAAVALVGGGVRLVGVQRFERDIRAASGRTGTPPDIAARALADQIAAVDSAQAASAEKRAVKNAAKKSGSSRTSTRTSTRASTRSRKPRTRSSAASGEPTLEATAPIARAPAVLDINLATAAEIERLPRIGPTLARRIVAWRDAHGPFTSLESLRHVSGIGPATVRLLEPLVTFSRGHSPLQREDPSSRERPLFEPNTPII